MADQDDASRTEELTSKRLAYTKESGQVAVSQDVKLWAALTASAILSSYCLSGAARHLYHIVLPFLVLPERFALWSTEVQAGFVQAMIGIGAIVAPVMLALAAVAVGSSLTQSGLIWAPGRIKPDVSKISPLKGLQRLCSPQSLVDFIKGLVKVAIVAAVAGALGLPLLHHAEASLARSLMPPSTSTKRFRPNITRRWH
ncbi:EscU/YscU/HrcU family type III secretion system export apparatus switch protein [Defluviicoccus vanus]|uniref:EscU/YscU/HrcU family type III secretion system export apparatus switch protein n=1 Tax=Defluviicoccus vanus TaxID=111831 RepID=A0A7H1MXD4_9PROT|nr:EscU/YscU/HrcU family type III secretion system export apparatus switch protein [Defluviicoccus vanus]QNT68120.1 EscU/YscU/HrcU family type III secretion system export apparatus switch protein [Defluviicoccus vanus]